MTVDHVKFRRYAGCRIKDSYTKFDKPAGMDHLDRALYLTSLVEVGGKFGLVQSYDGAGMSCGLEHKIALYPRNKKQGSLWGMLAEIRAAVAPCSCPELGELMSALTNVGWTLDAAGVLRHADTGREVGGNDIRNEFTPPNGKVPKTGPEWEQAKRWIELWHGVFAHPATFQVQIESARKGLLKHNRKGELSAYKAACGLHPTVLKARFNITEEQDLAMCMYHAHSVNAPAIARKCLTASRPDATPQWPKRLIRTLGLRDFARWKDNRRGNNRYDRTRVLAMKSGLWEARLFEGPQAIMPKNF